MSFEIPILAEELVPNAFDPENYLQLDLRYGVMRDRVGRRCIILSGFLLRGMYIGLKNECGPAWRLVLRGCGEQWGKKFAERFLKEIEEFYQEDLSTMTMGRLVACIEEFFATTGWGRLHIDFSLIDHGLIQAEVENPILGEVLRDVGEKMDVLFEGVLKELFTKVSGVQMDCYETQSIAEGAPTSCFIIGLASRMEPVSEWIEDENLSHGAIISRLMNKNS